MFFRHFKHGTAKQTVTVKVPFWNESPFAQLAVPSLHSIIDRSIGRTRNPIITDDDGGEKDAVVGQFGTLDFRNACDSQHIVARSYGYVRV
jgi:hypothetical protein